MTERNNLKVLLTLILKSESDVLLARRRARQIALLLGFGSQDQIRISTAVSEIVRIAQTSATEGKVQFCISDTKVPFTLTILVTTKGGNRLKENELWEGNNNYVGLNSAKNLVDTLVVDAAGSTLSIRVEKILVQRLVPFSAAEIDGLAQSLTKLVSTTPLDEVHQQNQELLLALDQLSSHQLLLNQLNNKLKENNEELVRLYGEVKDFNNSLEEKVASRTAELAKARDEAIKANELKSQFVANISHEIRSPMSGILGLTEVLKKESAGEAQEIATYVHNSALRLMTLVNDILDMSKLEAGDFQIENEVFRVDQIVDDTLTGFYITALNKNIKLSQHVDPSLFTDAFGPAARIRQVLLNLVQNALKFIDEGSVSVSAQQIKCEDNMCYAKFSITDTGPGISEEDQQKLFKLFVQLDGSTTRKHEGTGLGLALCMRLVALMGGTIGVESTLGEGSTFWFIVPFELGAVSCKTESR